MIKSKFISVRVTPKYREKFDEAVRKSGMTQSRYVQYGIQLISDIEPDDGYIER